jgi:integrase
MASICNDPGGRKRIVFEAPNGTRPAVRLGAVPTSVAKDFAGKVDHLIACHSAPHLVSDDVLRWAKSLPPKQYAKLVAADLLPPLESATTPTITLAGFLDEYFNALKVKPGTATAYGHTRRNLLAHFGADRNILAITHKDADAFHTWLAKHDFARATPGAKPRRLSAATVSRRILCARHIFNKAQRWKYLVDNPFAGIKAGQQRNAARKYFVPREMIDAAIASCPDAQWKLLIALSRYGGLRCPSEHLALKWADVDWERGALTVPSSKTEHQEGGESRVLPLFPELRPHLLAVFDAAEPGEEFIITRYRTVAVNLRTQFLRILKRAGVRPWPRLFQNLRATRETELMREYPIETVCAWIGNTPEVAVVHYLNDPMKDDHFRRASGTTAEVDKAARNPARTAVDSGGQEGDSGRGWRVQKHRNPQRIERFCGLRGWA